MKLRRKYLRLFRIIAYSGLFLCLFSRVVSAQYDEDIIKAVYIERITRFVEWPHNQISRDTGCFVIGIYGDNEFFNTLKKVLENKTVKDKQPDIVQITATGQIASCDLCYFSGIVPDDVESIMSQANQNGVLVMSGAEDLGANGTHINFFLEDNKLKFEINKSSLDSGRFKVSSMLLKISKII